MSEQTEGRIAWVVSAIATATLLYAGIAHDKPPYVVLGVLALVSLVWRPASIKLQAALTVVLLVATIAALIL